MKEDEDKEVIVLPENGREYLVTEEQEVVTEDVMNSRLPSFASTSQIHTTRQAK